MGCTYSSVEIQRTPELRVFKKCLFFDKPCAEIRAARMCPLLKRGAPPEKAVVPLTQRADRDVLDEELKRVDSIPSLGGELKSDEEAETKKIEELKESKAGQVPSEVELLKAELSDFMEKIEKKEEKSLTPEPSSSAGEALSEARKRKPRKPTQK